MKTENKQYRYPGTRPFTENESSLFFGRDTDIEKLSQKIILEQLLVLFGKSGLGKSSLLNAGVLPKLKKEKNYLSVPIRFGYADKDKNPVSVFINSISNASKSNNVLDKIVGNEKEQYFNESFWIACKKLQLQNKNKTILLILDQFEELFLFPEKQIKQFSELLSVLLFGEIPQKIQNKIYEKLDEDEEVFTQNELESLFEKINIKFVCSIRSDKLSLLNRLRQDIPQILQKNYELQALNINQAEEAMLKPANAEGDFLSNKFNYETTAKDKIINYLSENKEKQIETFQLQLICQYCENIIIKEGGKTDNIVSNSELGELNTIFSRHYDNLISEIPEKQRGTTRKLIEENMIIDGNRVPLPDKVIISKHKMSKELLQKLVNSRLLRSEPNTTGGYSYEISHDTLIEPISSAYKIRFKKENEEKELRIRNEELRIANQKAEKERIEREKERKRQRNIITIVGVAAVVSILFGIFGFWQMQKANANFIDALNLQVKGLHKDATANMKDEEYKTAIGKYEQLLELYKKYPNFNFEDNTAEKQIVKCNKLDDKKKIFYKNINIIDTLLEYGNEIDLIKADSLIISSEKLKYEPGLQKIEDRKNTLEIKINKKIGEYLKLAEKLRNMNYNDNAKIYIEKAKKLDPDNEQLN